MSSGKTTKSDATAQIAGLLRDADADTQAVMKLTLEVEQAKLYQRDRNKSGTAKEIAERVRRTIK